MFSGRGNPLFYIMCKVCYGHMHRKSNTWVSDNCLTPNKQFFSNIMARTSYDDDCYIHKTNTLGNITLILRQPVFDFTPYCCACDAANINFIVFSFTWTGLEPTIYYSKWEHANHYIINVIKRNEILYKSKLNNDRQSLNSSSKLRMSWNRNSVWVGIVTPYELENAMLMYISVIVV